jgi:hypothetical protein
MADPFLLLVTKLVTRRHSQNYAEKIKSGNRQNSPPTGPAQSQPTATRHNPVLGIRPVFGHILVETTTFNPTVPLRDAAETTTAGKAGRMQVSQGLFHDRKLPSMIMEQMVDYNSKLGHLPEIADRKQFGEGLVRAMASTVDEKNSRRRNSGLRRALQQ